jgi:hypothetical protein
MTKQEVLDLIATNLETGSNITAAKHREVEEAIVNYVGLSPVAYGKIGPIDIANAATSWPTTGYNIIGANRVALSGKFLQIRISIESGVLTSTNFKVRTEIESASVAPNLDNDMLGVLFRKDGSSTTTFDILLEEISPETASIFLHVEVVQL